MRLAIIGLGKMGGNMARRLLLGGHEVVGWDRTEGVAQELAHEVELVPAASLSEVISLLSKPKIIWLMVPAGAATEGVIQEAATLLSAGDILVDGGNSNFNDSIRRGAELQAKGIHFLDVGTSGGVWGLKEGYSMMVGGEKATVEHMRPIFETLAPAPDQGWGWVGPNGAGHFVKMVHNGIEYGMMEAYAEGFEIMRARTDFKLDLQEISQIWRYGSVVRSWLLDLFGEALRKDFTAIRDVVADSGEGRWTVEEAIKEGIPAPVIALSLFRRFESQQPESFSGKLLAAVRNEFGGHAILMKDEK